MIHLAFVYETIEDLVSYSKEAEGEYLKDLDNKNLIERKNKGIVGSVIEQSFFGYAANSKAEADFADIGVELKTTGIIKQKRGTLAAKERLVLNIINYMDEVERSFFTSSMWTKNNKILIFFYTYVRDSEGKADYPYFQIVRTILHEFNAIDLEIIKQDWNIIQDKVRSGLAHELSEGDTNILGACTKGASSQSVRNQPFSDIPAKQRAYSLKQGYMTSLVRQYIKNEKLISFTSPEELKGNSIEDIIKARFDKYLDKNEEEIANKLGHSLSTAKNNMQLLISEILGIKGTSLNKIEEFAKLNIKFKTVVYEESGTLKESMSFENLNFNEIYNTSWEESELKMKMESTQWLLVVFQRNKQGQRVLKGIKLWHLPEETLNKEVKNMFEEIKRLLTEGIDIQIDKKGRYKNNLPKTSFNGVSHVRSKGVNREKSMITLPNGQRIPNQAFWFNAKFVKSITKHLL